MNDTPESPTANAPRTDASAPQPEETAAAAPLAHSVGEGPGVRAFDDSVAEYRDQLNDPPSTPAEREGAAVAAAAVVGVRFIEAGAISYCSPGELLLGVGDYVIVHTDRGDRLGWIVLAPDQILAGRPEGPLRVIERIASEPDVHQWQQQRERAKEDISRAQALAARSDPRLRVAAITYDLSGTRGELTFTAPERVDHRWFEQQLTELLAARITVTQVGDRDRAKATAGIDICGRELCCASWMTEFPAISIRLAKEQDLPPNPTKISGVCGRLLCCLAFEVDAYRELRGDLPKTGKRITTPIGRAKVLSVNSLRQVVRLRFDETGEIVEMSADELRKQYGTAVRPEELEPIVEEPARRRDRRNQDTMFATMELVTAPPPRAAAEAAATLELDAGAAPALADADADAAGGEDAETGPKRRRRGRRGGRGHRRDGTSDATDASAPPTGFDAPADHVDASAD
ncbi:MAG: hypothetical protein EXR63_05690 [Dehalococcoidia bacterium]|nr:hypothetical protein [Dehalococcoidia bacterium]